MNPYYVITLNLLNPAIHIIITTETSYGESPFLNLYGMLLKGLTSLKPILNLKTGLKVAVFYSPVGIKNL